MRLPRYAPVIAIAATCLLLGSTGGAVAGSLITGRQIKDNTVTTKDIKNKTVSTKDLAPKTAKSLKGVSPWDTIPSGKTVTGRFYQYDMSGASIINVAENVNLPAKAPKPPVGYGFGPDSLAFTAGAADPACTGTFKVPKAAPGHVCVYMGGGQGIVSATVDPWDGVQQQTHTFFMSFGQEAADSVYEYWGNWAYTAP